MTICQLYDETPQIPQEEERYAVALEVPEPRSNLTSRGAFFLGFAATWIWWIFSTLAVIGTTLLYLITLCQISWAKKLMHRSWSRFAFSASCSLGCFVAVFSLSLGVSFLCLSLVAHADGQGSSGLVDFLKTHLEGSL